MRNLGTLLSIFAGIWCAIIIFTVATIILSSCAVKPKYLIEETLKEEAQQEINARQEQWNWKNRHRLRQKQNMLQYRNPQLGIGRNTYNPNKSGQRKHVTPKKYNGVAVHKKNYWSRTTNDPQKDE